MTSAGWHIPNKTGITLFMTGALVGYVLFMAAFLQDTESIVFSANVSGDATLRTLSCPELLIGSEQGEVTAAIDNHTEKRLLRSVRTHISKGYLTLKQEDYQSVYLEPGESRTLRWTVTADDAAWGYVILVKVYVLPQNPYPSYVGTCGIMVLDLPYLSGWQVIAALWTASSGLMAAGYFKYLRANQPLVRARRKLAVTMRVIAVTVVLAMSTIFLEFWYLEVVFFVFTTILLAESTFSFSQN